MKLLTWKLSLSHLARIRDWLEKPQVQSNAPGRRGAADVSFVAEYVDCLDGLGTMGSGAHTPQETVNLNTIEDLTKRAAILIYRLIHSKDWLLISKTCSRHKLTFMVCTIIELMYNDWLDNIKSILF